MAKFTKVLVGVTALLVAGLLYALFAHNHERSDYESFFLGNTGSIFPEVIQACANGPTAPFWSCDDLRPLDASTLADDAAFFRAMQPICEQPTMRSSVRTTIPCSFARNFQTIYSSRKWVKEAFVTYIHGPPRSQYMQMTEALVESVHQFSSRSVIVFCVSAKCDEGALKPSQYPHLLVVNIDITPATAALTMDLFKWLGAVLARVNTGFELDADQIVLPHVDTMFPRYVALHTTCGAFINTTV